MKQLEVTILGQSYILGCPEGGEAALLAAVAEVDREMCAIRDAGKVRARERIAVLAALNLAYQLAQRPQTDARPQTPAGSESRSGGHSPAAADTERFEALVRRIDAALGDDSRLL